MNKTPTKNPAEWSNGSLYDPDISLYDPEINLDFTLVDIDILPLPDLMELAPIPDIDDFSRL